MNDELIKNELITKINNIYKNYDGEIYFSFCPYRVCPVGAHIDHQKGKVTGFAINYGITIGYIPRNDHYFEATSLNFEGTKKENILNISNRKNDWADYLRGVCKLLYERYGITKGINCVISGSLPIGGLSSSAAVTISFMNAICHVNNINISREEMIKLAQEVENKYVGVNSGTLDQSCELLCEKDKLLFLDTLDGSFKLIEKNSNMLPYKIAIIFSGVKRTLVGSQYNTRVDELKSASYCLKAFANVEYGKYQDSVLRDVERNIYEMYKEKLPENFRKRAEHYYTEMDRVERAIEAWKNGNIEAFGKISFESGDSSINNYEAGSPELIAIHNIMKETKGIYGGRFSGAGFKGCCLALINPKYEKSIREEITEKYLNLFPQYKDLFNIYYTNTSDGCNISNKVMKK